MKGVCLAPFRDSKFGSRTSAPFSGGRIAVWTTRSLLWTRTSTWGRGSVPKSAAASLREMIDVTPNVHAGWSSEEPALHLQLDMDLDTDVEVSSSPALSSSSSSTREGRFTWRAPDVDEELWAPSTPKDSPKVGVSRGGAQGGCFTPPALSPDADSQPHQITVFDGRSGLPQKVLQQPKLLVNHMRKHQDRSDILMQCCVWLQLQVQNTGRLAHAHTQGRVTQAHTQVLPLLTSKIAWAGCHGC
jgi:hypothetical protein